MDAAAVFRQGLGSLIPRPPQYFQHVVSREPPPPLHPLSHHHLARPTHHNRDDVDGDHRIAHTLTACCRCRQRKTKCDATLPRCLPCERSGSICEYFDTTKGRKISRSYVVKLQAKVKQLEAELAQFTDEDEFPRNSEDMVRPGGLVRLDENDESVRYLGPSSGIAMTRLLMEEAKRFTESKRISELIPEVRARRSDRANRMQSIVSLAGSISGPSGRKKSYPMISAHAATVLPARPVADRLVDVFLQRAQVFTPALHEVVFARELNEVFAGDADPHKNFMVRMVMAISLQKLDAQYAGLADSYYLAAMQYFEDVVRPKDLRTLQCLALIGQYSLLTPTRTAVYYVIGLATRICQQLGLGDEKTITSGCSLGLVDPLVLDMRRRLSWIIMGMELGLAQVMGRPNGFAKGDDLVDVGFFDVRHDVDITPEGINEEGAPSEKKLVAIHFCKMRLCQAEIRRVLYEKKRHEPRDANHPWFARMEQKIQDWLDAAPEQPVWCKPWFTGRYHTMVVCLHRPSPQVPKPSAASALKCFDSAAYVVELSSQQVKKAAIDITWVFLLTVYMSLNTLLWSVSYAEVRHAHAREQLERLVSTALEIIEQCSERWPGTGAASQHYIQLARACMQSYEANQGPSHQQQQQHQRQQEQQQAYTNFATPPSLTDTNSPSASEHSGPAAVSGGPSQGQPSLFTTPQFGYMFESGPSEPAFMFDNGFDNGGGDFPARHPQFRTGSIFLNRSSTDPITGRRQSCFPPDFIQSDDDGGPGEPRATLTPHDTSRAETSPPPLSNTLPTPPDSLGPGPGGMPHASSLSPPLLKMAPEPRSVSPTPTRSMYHSPTPPMTLDTGTGAVPAVKFEPQTPQQTHRHPTPQTTPPQPQSIPTSTPQQRGPTFTVPPLPGHHGNGHPQQHPRPQQHNPQQLHQQRPLPGPTSIADWFNAPPPFVSPYAFSSAGVNAPRDGNATNGFAADPSNAFVSSMGGPGFPAGTGGGGANGGPSAPSGPYGFYDPMRQGSLTQDQLAELMGVLETDGVTEINQFLNANMTFDGLAGGGSGASW